MARATRKTSTSRKRKTTSAKSPAKSTAKTSKTAAAAKAAAASAPAPEPVVAKSEPVVSGPALKKKELIERVVARSGIKKKDAKPVVEAMLAELGEALARGNELNLRPLGKVKVTRHKEQPKADVYVCKLRQPKAPALPKDPLAKAAE